MGHHKGRHRRHDEANQDQLELEYWEEHRRRDVRIDLILAFLFLCVAACLWVWHEDRLPHYETTVVYTLPPDQHDLNGNIGRPAGVLQGSPAGPLSSEEGLSSGVGSKDSAGMPGTGHATPGLADGRGGDALRPIIPEIKTVGSKSRPLSRNSARPAQSFRPGPMVKDWPEIWKRDYYNDSTTENRGDRLEP